MSKVEIDLSEARNIAENVNTIEAMNKLIIVVDLEKTIGLSSSGKMMGIASTGGFIRVPATTTRGKTVKMNLYIGESS